VEILRAEEVLNKEEHMHLMRIGAAGSEKPIARLDDEHYVDLSDVVIDFDERFFGSGMLADLPVIVAERQAAGQVIAFAGERVGAPFARPHQILCIGLNYRDHAAETGAEVPTEPILFTKSPNTLIGPNDDVRIPRGSTKPDWEVELGIVIGRRASYLESVDDAREAIAGFCVVNDVSERAFQIERGGQWSKGKSAETFNPAGPWLVTPDEISDVLDLDMRLDVSGVRRQTGSTSTMVFDPYFIVHYLSQFMVLEPGDLINTGTPPGVGMGLTPPVWLQPGDVMELEISGLGVQRQTVVAPSVGPSAGPSVGSRA
jgi:2,4-diketo-3-deoxy-L-fuconate hydrolase